MKNRKRSSLERKKYKSLMVEPRVKIAKVEGTVRQKGTSVGVGARARSHTHDHGLALNPYPGGDSLRLPQLGMWIGMLVVKYPIPVALSIDGEVGVSGMEGKSSSLNAIAVDSPLGEEEPSRELLLEEWLCEEGEEEEW